MLIFASSFVLFQLKGMKPRLPMTYQGTQQIGWKLGPDLPLDLCATRCLYEQDTASLNIAPQDCEWRCIPAIMNRGMSFKV